MEPRWLKVSHVAVYLDTSPSQVYRWLKDGLLPEPVMIGNTRRWDRVAIDRALDPVSGTGLPSNDPDLATDQLVDTLSGEKAPRKKATR